jgi:hypothetical protein
LDLGDQQVGLVEQSVTLFPGVFLGRLELFDLRGVLAQLFVRRGELGFLFGEFSSLKDANGHEHGCGQSKDKG